jgi:alkanesulfonate monooxygenase SsuD/methylene tetrahydromethanopterin reductase-like flavin-dependent oxidoreductase (luciferase family)
VSFVRLGVTLPQFTEDRGRFLDGVRRAEALGFDSVWVFDHLWPLSGGRERPVLEAWTSLAWVAEATERVSVGTLVTRSSLRNPRVLSHMARTVAKIAPDRLIVGVGSGDRLSRRENEAFGIPYWEGADRIAQLENAVSILRMETEAAGVRVWVAGRSDDALALAAQQAHAWNGWGGTPEAFARDAASVVDYSEGRDVELTWGGVVQAETLDHEAARLNGFIEAGARHLVCTLANAWRPGLYERLAETVRPSLLDVGYPPGV